MRKLPGGGFLGTGVDGKAWVEASLPKRVNDDNIEGLTVPEAHEALQGLISEACEYVTPTDRVLVEGVGSVEDVVLSVDNPKIVRLDLVRDFQLRAPRHLGHLLDGLSGVKREGRTRTARFADGGRGNAQTLMVGPKSWSSRLYDKHAETVGKAPEGRLRFEAELRQKQLSSVFAKKHCGSISHVSDLEEDRLAKLRRAWFRRSGFDRCVVADPDVWTVLLQSGLPPMEQLKLRGWLDALANGVLVDVGLERTADYRLRQLASAVGIVAGGLHSEISSIVLDFDLGFEVVAA
jgi:hypothetical protein